MLSFLEMDIQKIVNLRTNLLTIWSGPPTSKVSNVSYSGQTWPRPQVYHSSVLSFNFKVTRSVLKPTFQLQFSFHNTTSVPQRVAEGGRWNCSVPHWADFQQHLPCNLEWECAGGEDEAACPYTSWQCARGEFRLAGSCYVYVVADRPLTWTQAAQDCQRRHSHLVSLNDLHEWAAVTSLLIQRHDPECYIGMRWDLSLIPNMYSQLFRWVDNSFSFMEAEVQWAQTTSTCTVTGAANIDGTWNISNIVVKNSLCERVYRPYNYICERPIGHETSGLADRKGVSLQHINPEYNSSFYSACPAGHVTHAFLSCDLQSACWAYESGFPQPCRSPLQPPPPMFACSNGVEHVPYTLVCDHRPDCSDHSDELCRFPPCSEWQFHCGDQQCISKEEGHNKVCDNVVDCVTGVDEIVCKRKQSLKSYDDKKYDKPGLVNFDGRGSFTLTAVNQSAPVQCPPTHFLCVHQPLHCLPVYVRCNGVNDCPRHEDEAACEESSCPGFYRCRASRVCLHPDHVCDGVFQCPQHDDELLCRPSCPHGCVCYGLAFYCPTPVPLHDYPHLRFLEAAGSGINFSAVSTNSMLVRLGLSRCSLRQVVLPVLNNLREMDLSDNFLATLNSDRLRNVERLRYLNLAGNPLQLWNFSTEPVFPSLRSLDISRVAAILELRLENIVGFPNLEVIKMRNSGLRRVSHQAFQSLPELRILDIRGCPIVSVHRHMFKGLANLQQIFTDDFKLCCPALLPDGLDSSNCFSQSDIVSSCESLLSSKVYRIVLILYAICALLTNVASFVYHVLRSASSDGVLLTHLSVSDLLTGVYLAIIGVAELRLRGRYLWEDEAWRDSAVCRLAGLVWLLSCQVSALVLCLLTVDRALAVHFPLHRLSTRSTHLACLLAWTAGLALAAAPLLLYTEPDVSYYGQTALCLPLPLAQRPMAEETFSLAAFRAVNYVLCLLTVLGQSFVHWAGRRKDQASADQTKDVSVARALTPVVLSTCFCWFLLGVAEFLALRGVHVPEELGVVAVIVVLSLSPVLHPFLYALNVRLERSRVARRQLFHQRALQRVQADNRVPGAGRHKVDTLTLTYTRQHVSALVHKWLTAGLLTEQQKAVALGGCGQTD